MVFEGGRAGSDLLRRRRLMQLGAGVAGMAAAGIATAPTAAAAAATTPGGINGWFDVRDHGATGNGTTDDSTAIQQAVLAAENAGGGIVWLPQGRYRLANEIRLNKNNVTLLGSGRNTLLYRTTAQDGVITIGHASDNNECVGNAVVDLAIDRAVAPDGDFDGKPSWGVAVRRAQQTTLRGLHIHNAGYGIVAGVRGASGISCQWTSISGCWFRGRNSPLLGNSVFPGACLWFWECADQRVHDVFCEPSNIGIMMTENSNGITISDSSVLNGAEFQYGIVGNGTGFCRMIESCVLENARQQQVYIAGSSWSTTIANSWIGAGDGASARKGVLIERGTHDITVTGTRIGDQRSSAIASYGDRVSITGNTFMNNTGNGDYSQPTVHIGGGSGVVLSGNIFRTGVPGRTEVKISGSRDVLVTGNVAPQTGQLGCSATESNTNVVLANNIF